MILYGQQIEIQPDNILHLEEIAQITGKIVIPEKQIELIRPHIIETGHCPLDQRWNYKRVISPFSRIYLIEAGEAIVRHSGKEFRLKAGDLHLIPCHVYADYECPRAHTQFHVSFFARLNTGVDLFDIYRCQSTLNATDIDYTIFRRLCSLAETKELRLADSVEARGLLLILISRFLRTTKEAEPAGVLQDDRFSTVLVYMDENLHRDITLQNLADLTGLVPTYFSDQFQKIIGIRPIELLNKRRIERAQLLLSTTDLAIQEIAEKVGVRNPAYFSRLFLNLSGVSARRYRQLLRNL